MIQVKLTLEAVEKVRAWTHEVEVLLPAMLASATIASMSPLLVMIAALVETLH